MKLRGGYTPQLFKFNLLFIHIQKVSNWNIGNSTFSGHSGNIYGLAFSSDHSYLASCSFDNSVKVWSSLFNWTLDNGGECDAVIGLPNGLLASSVFSSQTINIWDPLNNVAAPIKILTGHSGGVYSLALSPNGLLIASGSGDNSIKIWDYSSQTNDLKTLTGHSGAVGALCFVSDQILASGSFDSSIKIWNLTSGNFEFQI